MEFLNHLSEVLKPFENKPELLVVVILSGGAMWLMFRLAKEVVRKSGSTRQK